MKKLTHFWRAIENVVGQEAVRAQWRLAMAGDWEWGGKLLRPAGRLADVYPQLDLSSECPCGYRVICHDEERDDFVGVCSECGGRLKLTLDELVVYELDLRAVAGQIAAAMELVCDFSEAVGIPHTWRVGVYHPLGDAKVWAYLALAPEPADLAAIVAILAVRRTPFILLTPTRSRWRAWSELDGTGALVLAAEEVFSIWGQRLVAGIALRSACTPKFPALVQGAANLQETCESRQVPRFPKLRLDPSTFTIHLGRRRCVVRTRSRQLFTLFERLCRHPGQRVLFHQLRSKGELWEDFDIEDVSIRGAVSRLRKMLRGAKMTRVAAAITTGREQNRAYVIFDPGRQSANSN